WQQSCCGRQFGSRTRRQPFCSLTCMFKEMAFLEVVIRRDFSWWPQPNAAHLKRPNNCATWNCTAVAREFESTNEKTPDLGVFFIASNQHRQRWSRLRRDSG